MRLEFRQTVCNVSPQAGYKETGREKVTTASWVTSELSEQGTSEKHRAWDGFQGLNRCCQVMLYASVIFDDDKLGNCLGDLSEGPFL